MLTICCTDRPAGTLSAQVEAFKTVNPVCFLMVKRPAFPPQLNTNTRTTVADRVFPYFPDTQDYRPIITPALPVVNGSALHQPSASPSDTATVSLPQKMYRLELLRRPQNFASAPPAFPCQHSGQPQAFSAADFHPSAAASAAVPLCPDRRIFSSS